MFGAHCGPPLRHSFCDIFFFSLSLSRSLSSGNRRALIEIRWRCVAGRSDDVMVTIGSELFPTPKVPIVRVCVFAFLFVSYTPNERMHACTQRHSCTFFSVCLTMRTVWALEMEVGRSIPIAKSDRSTVGVAVMNLLNWTGEEGILSLTSASRSPVRWVFAGCCMQQSVALRHNLCPSAY